MKRKFFREAKISEMALKIVVQTLVDTTFVFIIVFVFRTFLRVGLISSVSVKWTLHLFGRPDQ